MVFRVEISAPALRDAESLYEWIADASKERADEWLRGLIIATDSLKDFPDRNPIAPESHSFLIEIRQLLYGKRASQCRIIYGVSVDEKTGEGIVLIYRIRNTRQKPLGDMEILGEIYDD